ncbi:formylmethanofuran dehydrogenase [Xanthobacter dioxanivorans]|uniref:Formylmethanofuran dehydrogenase n=1 Tax=Xanthobacter dioxanivorans TaxID=2528964 RepID=A0A974SK67_9HYPH|nr:formylmethanofuran dehydrogenase [Xanthobacter dioxanivorans]QRG08167.1 formylmethanofuran dehydrogenase [Xanthobacter dioxanivorans]
MTSGASDTDGAARIVRDVVCGFCGLGCDDLEVAVTGRAIAPRRACPEAARLLARTDAPPPSARIAGTPASLEDAAAAAARHLAASRSAVFSGLGADLEGLRRLYDIAMVAGASLDHAASAGLFANLERLARRGWIAATLAEVRNRCDVLVVLGADPASAFAHFFERAMPSAPVPADADAAPLFVPHAGGRSVVIVGGPLSDTSRAQLTRHDVVEITVPEDRIATAAAALSAALAGRATEALAGLPLGVAEALALLAGRLKAARYGVLTWNAATLPPEDAAAVAGAAAEAVDILNVTTRAAVFPLGGRDNVTGAHQLALWRFGYPLRTVVGAGTARHVPDLYATATALADADLLLHASAFRPDPPPGFDRGPVIALAHPGTAFAREPEVFIPVGTPGVDHAGHVFRMDSVICLPLQGLRPAELPSVAAAARAILAALGRAA